MTTAQPVDVVSVQSQVMHGSVGNSIALPVLDRFDLRAVGVPTAIYSNTPHYPTFHGEVMPAPWFAGLLKGLEDRGVAGHARAVLAGYLGSPTLGYQLAAWLCRLAARPERIVLIDPVLGDTDHGLYVSADLIPVYRDALIPLAGGLTPNHFELEQLTGSSLRSLDSLLAAARSLLAAGPEWIIVTSALPSLTACRQRRVVVVERDRYVVLEHPGIPHEVKGTGDFFTAVLLALILRGTLLIDATRMACDRVFAMTSAARQRGWKSLPIPDHRLGSDSIPAVTEIIAE